MEKRIKAKLDNSYTPEVDVKIDPYDQHRIEVSMPQFYVNAPIVITFDDIYKNKDKSQALKNLASTLKERLGKALASFMIMTDGIVSLTAGQVDALKGTVEEEPKTSKVAADYSIDTYVDIDYYSVNLHVNVPSQYLAKTEIDLFKIMRENGIPDDQQEAMYKRIEDEIMAPAKEELKKKAEKIQNVYVSMCKGIAIETARLVKERILALLGKTVARKEAGRDKPSVHLSDNSLQVNTYVESVYYNLIDFDYHDWDPPLKADGKGDWDQVRAVSDKYENEMKARTEKVVEAFETLMKGLVVEISSKYKQEMMTKFPKRS